MDRCRITLFVISALKCFVSLTIAVFLVYPAKLSHIQNGTEVGFGNDSLGMFNQMGCRTPRANVNVTNKEMTAVLNLPEGTILYDQLHTIGICKASAKKLGIVDTGCLCLNYWPIYLHFIVTVVCCFINLSAAIINVSSIKAGYKSFSIVEMKALLSWCHYTAVMTMLMLLTSVYHATSLHGNIHYSLPNAFDRPYYEVPSLWLSVIVFDTIYSTFCMAELLTLYCVWKKLTPNSVVKTKTFQPVVVQIEKCSREVPFINNSIVTAKQLPPASQLSLEYAPATYTPSSSAIQPSVVSVNQEMKLPSEMTTKDASTQTDINQTIHVEETLATPVPGKVETKICEWSFSI